MIVHSYARFSDPKQEGGDSLRRQREAAVEFCNRKGWTLSDLTFTDSGRSGFRGDKQRALMAFLAAIDDGRVKPGETLLVEAVDRLSRKGVRTTQTLVNRILNAGINIAILVPVEKVYRADDNNDIGGAIELAAFAFQAHTYSENLSSRVKAYAKNARNELRNGTRSILSGPIPSWLTFDGSKFGKRPDAVKTVRLVFKRTIEGIGRKQLLRELNSKYPGGIGTRKNSRAWNETMIAKIITGRSVLGELKSTVTGEVFPNYYPAVIDEKTWRKANAAAAERRRQRGPQNQRVNLFNGILYHALDGCSCGFYSYVKKDAEGNRKSYCRYKSYRRTNGEAGTDSATVDVRRFEDLIFNFLPTLDLNSRADNPHAELIAERDYLKVEIEAMQKQIVTKSGSATVLAAPLAQLGEQLEEVEERLSAATVTRTLPTKDYRKKLAEMRRGTVRERQLVRDRIRQIVETIYLYPIKLGTKRCARVRSLVEIHFKTGEFVRGIELDDHRLIKVSGRGKESLLQQCQGGFRVTEDDYREIVELSKKAR